MTATGHWASKSGPPSMPHGARVLVTGAAGFVGRRLVSRLRAMIPPTQLFLASRALGVKADGTVELDLGIPDSIVRALTAVSPNIVIHLAAQSSVGQADAGRTWSTNAAGTLSLASAIAAHCPTATVLYASSAEVYGAAFNRGVVSEASAPLPLSAYSRSKFAAEQMLSDVLSPNNRLVIARPSNHSGAGQDQRFVLPSFASQIVSGAREIQVGNLSAERDFLHVEDVVDAYVALIAAAGDLERCSIFNIASGQTVSVGSLLDRMIALAASPAVVVVDPLRLRPSDVAAVKMDTQRLRATTGWQPTRSIEQMLQEILAGCQTAANSQTA